MATANPFDLLGDNDNDDPSLLIAAQQQKIAAKKPAPAPAGGAAAAKLPSKPAPPAQAVKDARSNTAPARGGFPGGTGGGRGGPGRGRGGRGGGPGQGRDYGDGSLNGYAGGYGGAGGGGEESETGRPLDRERGSYGGPRQSYRGGRRGGYGNGEDGGDFGRPRRVFERHSGTGRGNEIKREGSGRGNWGNPSDDGTPQEAEEVAKLEDKVLAAEKLTDQEVAPVSDVNKEGKDGADNENEDKEPEEKEMTLDEYEKLREEKRKALLSMKVEERKVDFDKDFESMQQLSLKKGNDEVFIKLCSDKDSKRKDNVDRDERVKKSVSINQFLKPADGERYYSGGGGRGRGRGRGRGDRGQFMGGFGGGGGNNGVTTIAPAIDDPGHFPTLGGKQ